MRAPVLRLAALFGFAGSALALSGCGFTPLYATEGLTQSMAQIDVEAPQTRTGYFLEQDLKNGFQDNPSAPKLYKLTIKMTEQHYSIGYKVDETTTRSEITNSVAYELTDIETGKVMLKGQFPDTVTYDSSSSPFTGVVSQQDGQVRIASDISQKLQNAIAIYFHDKH